MIFTEVVGGGAGKLVNKIVLCPCVSHKTKNYTNRTVSQSNDQKGKPIIMFNEWLNWKCIPTTAVDASIRFCYFVK